MFKLNKIKLKARAEYLGYYFWLDVKWVIKALNNKTHYPILTNSQSAKLLFDGMHSPGALPGDRQPNWKIQPMHIKNVFREKAALRKKGTPVITRHPSGFTQIIRGDGTVHSYIPFTTGHWKKNV